MSRPNCASLQGSLFSVPVLIPDKILSNAAIRLAIRLKEGETSQLEASNLFELTPEGNGSHSVVTV